MMDNMTRQAIGQAVMDLKGEMIEMLAELVKIPSVTGDEGPAQELVKKAYTDMGLQVESFTADRIKLETHPAFCDTGLSYEGRSNIIGILKGDPVKKSLILNAHIDVVSPEPVDQWTNPPFSATIKENRLYGRGASDNKSGVVACFYALKALEKCGYAPQGTVILESTIEEEQGGGGGALACLIEGYLADGMMVADDLPWVTTALAGITSCKVSVEGRAAHPYEAQKGVSAISKIIPIYQALEQLGAERSAKVRYPLFEELGGPACHLVIGTINGGDWITKVPGSAEIGCRIGFVPGETRQEIQSLVEWTINEIANKDPWLLEHPPQIEWLPMTASPYYLDPEHPLVQTIIEAVGAPIYGDFQVKARGIPATTDARFGAYFDIPAVTMGVYNSKFIHAVDESVDLDALAETTRAIALVVSAWCSQDK
ncbi:MAG: ArgE/DapE family deacylase [Anaerolineales bacterium]|nr:ArgE/DapE family deacylase [Anaerolineales bacterium]